MNNDANRLNLEREIWLDFRGRGMTVRDSITGEMSSGFRLDIGAPFKLMRAQTHGQALMVSGGGEDLTGVELRNPSVNLEASSRVASSPLTMPVTGWKTNFESVYTNLHLPPGRVLIAAIGADSCSQAWIDLISDGVKAHQDCDRIPESGFPRHRSRRPSSKYQHSSNRPGED